MAYAKLAEITHPTTLQLSPRFIRTLREQTWADVVFDKTAADSITQVVTTFGVFEILARDQFTAGMPGHTGREASRA
jgi:hypothetical protein